MSRHRVVGLSGTSGGAVCAFPAWYRLLNDGPAQAARLLEGFWAESSATPPHDRLVNAWMVWASRLQDSRRTAPGPCC